MNARPLPPSCRTCRGEGAVDGDHGDVTCPACHGTGEAPAPSLRAGLIAAACLAAAVVGYYAPVAWWTT